MNTRNRLYIMAFAAYTSALLVAAVFSWLAIQHNTAVGVAQLAVALSGNGIGGFALLLGILRDDRAQKAEEKAAKARQETEKFKQQADQLRQQAEQQRQRADRAEAELERLRASPGGEFAERIRRLEIAAGFAPPEESDDATEN